jgi:hypothetical protein
MQQPLAHWALVSQTAAHVTLPLLFTHVTSPGCPVPVKPQHVPLVEHFCPIATHDPLVGHGESSKHAPYDTP